MARGLRPRLAEMLGHPRGVRFAAEAVAVKALLVLAALPPEA